MKTPTEPMKIKDSISNCMGVGCKDGKLRIKRIIYECECDKNCGTEAKVTLE